MVLLLFALCDVPRTSGYRNISRNGAPLTSYEPFLQVHPALPSLARPYLFLHLLADWLFLLLISFLPHPFFSYLPLLALSFFPSRSSFYPGLCIAYLVHLFWVLLYLLPPMVHEGCL